MSAAVYSAMSSELALTKVRSHGDRNAGTLSILDYLMQSKNKREAHYFILENPFAEIEPPFSLIQRTIHHPGYGNFTYANSHCKVTYTHYGGAELTDPSSQRYVGDTIFSKSGCTEHIKGIEIELGNVTKEIVEKKNH